MSAGGGGGGWVGGWGEGVGEGVGGGKVRGFNPSGTENDQNENENHQKGPNPLGVLSTWVRWGVWGFNLCEWNRK